MEIIILILGYIVLNLIISWVKSVGKKEGYIGPPQLKFIDDTLDDTGLAMKKLMFRGKLPNTTGMKLSFGLSAIDITDGKGKYRPILSVIEAIQEETTICYHASGNFGHVNEGSSFTDWVQIGPIIPELLQAPYSGNREIKIVFRIFNTNNPPTIVCGLTSDNERVIFLDSLSFTHNFSDKGYEEASKDEEESKAISLKIGVAVAMADGFLDDTEGEILKCWIIREISASSENKQNKLKTMFNDVLKEGFSEAKGGNLSLTDLIERLSEIGNKKSKYAAIELCLDVMAADGVANPAEMAIIRNMAHSLDLDMNEIEKMREKVTLNLSIELTSDEGMELLVGIEESWSNEQKRKHLRSEFQKWSNRINSLPEGEERVSAQNILNNIAILRKKYG